MQAERQPTGLVAPFTVADDRSLPASNGATSMLATAMLATKPDGVRYECGRRTSTDSTPTRVGDGSDGSVRVGDGSDGSVRVGDGSVWSIAT